jgi:hypothetical protein
MSDWTAGYVADVGYTYGYYTELNPLRLRLAFLNAGLAFPAAGRCWLPRRKEWHKNPRSTPTSLMPS